MQTTAGVPPPTQKGEEMVYLRVLSKKVLLLAALLTLSAGYATASSFTLTSNSATMAGSQVTGTLSAITFFDLTLLQPSATTRTLRIGDVGGIMGTFKINGVQYNLTSGSSPYDLNFDSTNNLITDPSWIFRQDPVNANNRGFMFSTDWEVPTDPGVYYDVEISKSYLDLSAGTKWTIQGTLTGGATWTFLYLDSAVGKNQDDLVLQQTANVPEPSSLYMLVMGLGVGAQLFRKVRQAR
jgi:hypothetical protein